MGFGTTIELTRYKVEPDKVKALMEARPAMLADFRADRKGFIGARLVRLPDDEWLDIVEWRSPEDLLASRIKGSNRPGIRAFFSAIHEILSSEDGVLVDSDED